jgi:hypothetical protein
MVEGPFPRDPSKYGPGWSKYQFKVFKDGEVVVEGDAHAAPEEGVLRVIERVSVAARKQKH